jgi:hypothetical protein
MDNLRQWLIRRLGGTPKEPCNHKWRILIEHYPSYTKDYWQCGRCKVMKIFQNDEPPVPVQTEICNLGDIHIVNGLRRK